MENIHCVDISKSSSLRELLWNVCFLRIIFSQNLTWLVEFVFDEQKVAEGVNNQYSWVGLSEALRSFQSVLTILSEGDPAVMWDEVMEMNNQFKKQGSK